MELRRFDWVELAERAYDVTLSHGDWLESIAACLRPALDTGWGLMGGITDRRGTGFVPRVEFTMDAPRGSLAVSHLAWKLAPKPTEKFFATQGRINSSELYPGASPLLTSLAACLGFALADTSCFVASDGEGAFLGVAAPCRERAEPLSPQRRKPWKTAAEHVGAALRLRENLASLSLEDAAVEAVFDERGKVEHLRSGLAESVLVEELAALVGRKRDIHSRLEARQDETSLELWPALFSGTWSLVDRVESDGKRFVVAYRNEVNEGDPRKLSHRERQVADLAAQDASERQMAGRLAVSESTVRSHLASLLRKLGFSTRAEFSAYAKTSPQTYKVQLRSAELLVIEVPRPSTQFLEQLSPREREVVQRILRGQTVRAIARESGLSPRTIETQLASAYRKLDVKDRASLFELATR